MNTIDNILDVKNITFSYNGIDNIFEDISFSIEKGDVLCILGPNGTGKTTLIKCLNGLKKINSGDIFVNGKNLNSLSFSDISKNIGYVPQEHDSTFPFSVFEVVLMGRSPHIGLTDSPKEKDIKIAEDALKTMGISSMKDNAYTSLSGGEKQLVFLARVLAQKPDLLILDEPTSHLDFGNQIRLLEIIEKLSKTGLSIIMSSHFPDHAFLSSNKVAIMKNRKFIDFGSPDVTITEENLKKAYSINIKMVNISDIKTGDFTCTTKTDTCRKICVPFKSSEF
ncbi:MAG: ABC transporter ATP-binding protein [Methanobacteriaceae archaeon]